MQIQIDKTGGLRNFLLLEGKQQSLKALSPFKNNNKNKTNNKKIEPKIYFET